LIRFIWDFAKSLLTPRTDFSLSQSRFQGQLDLKIKSVISERAKVARFYADWTVTEHIRNISDACDVTLAAVGKNFHYELVSTFLVSGALYSVRGPF